FVNFNTLAPGMLSICSPGIPSFFHDPSSAGSTNPLSQYGPKSSTGVQEISTITAMRHVQNFFMFSVGQGAQWWFGWGRTCYQPLTRTRRGAERLIATACNRAQGRVRRPRLFARRATSEELARDVETQIPVGAR